MDFNGKYPDKAGIQQTKENTCNCRTFVKYAYFVLEELQVRGEHKEHLSGGKFQILISIDKEFEIVYGGREVMHVDAVQTVMISAMLGDYTNHSCNKYSQKD